MVGDRTTTATQSSPGTEIELAQRSLVKRLVEDLPLLQHGSGDVPPLLTNPTTTVVLASLTARYVSNLVDAALQAQNILCSDDRVAANRGNVRPIPSTAGAGGLLPPPVFTRGSTAKAASRRRTGNIRHHRRRSDEEYWDEPVVPKIRKKSKSDNNNNNNGEDSEDDDAMAVAMRWVGVAGGGGPDAFPESSRVRSSYVRGPHALGPQSFVFPVCHDTYAYNRVREIQGAKRSLEPLLMVDPTLADLVRTEGKPLKKKKKKAMAGKKKRGNARSNAAGNDDNGDADDDDDDDDPDDDDDLVDEDESDSADDNPVWQGLASILPVHRRRR